MIRKGFTLIELLVVVAVLALLASIVFSNLGGAREGAKISNALSFQSQTHSLLGSDLVGWWNFNEGSGSVAKDTSGYGNDGTITGATHVDGVPGTGGSALNFNGNLSHLSVPYSSAIQPDSITLSYWIRLNQDPNCDGNNNWRRIFYRMSPDHRPIRNILEQTRVINFTVWVGGLEYRYINGLFSGETLEVGEWAHLVYSYDSGTGNGYAYKNGDLSRSGTMVSGGGAIDKHPGDSWTSSSHLNVGLCPNGSGWLPATIDDARVYSRPLTSFEIENLYAQTKDSYLAND